jgi:hypothetical protein
MSHYAWHEDRFKCRQKLRTINPGAVFKLTAGHPSDPEPAHPQFDSGQNNSLWGSMRDSALRALISKFFPMVGAAIQRTGAISKG